MAIDPVSKIVDMFKEGFSLWKEYLKGREAAYIRKRDKQQEKAIGYGEQAFKKFNEYKNIVKTIKTPGEVGESLTAIEKEMEKLSRKFDKND